LALVLVKGKKEATCVHEVMAFRDEGRARRPLMATAENKLLEELAEAYESARAAFHAASFGEARALACKVLERWPGDLATRRLLGDIEQVAHKTREELANWTGAVVISEK